MADGAKANRVWKGVSDEHTVESAMTHHLSAYSGDEVALFEKLLTYDDLVERLQIPRRSLERLVSKGVLRKMPGLRLARFYWPDVLSDLRNRKGRKP